MLETFALMVGIVAFAGAQLPLLAGARPPVMPVAQQASTQRIYDRTFWSLWLGFFLSSAAGLAVIAHAAPLILDLGGSATEAALGTALPRDRRSRRKNVILLLGDGMGTSEITLARYYAKGAGGRLNLDALPFSGNYTTYSLTPGAGPSYLPDYVPDSAATGTAWATGKKTIDDRISQGPSSALDVPRSNSGVGTSSCWAVRVW